MNNLYMFVAQKIADFCLITLGLILVASLILVVRDIKKQRKIDRLNKVWYGKESDKSR